MINENDVVTLEIETTNGASGQLNIVVHDQFASPIFQRYPHTFNQPFVEKKCQKMIHFLNVSSRKGGTPEVRNKLINLGSVLSDELLHPEAKKELRLSDAIYLKLKITSDLLYIPWELLIIDQQFLCERFRIGRMVTTQKTITKSIARKTSVPLKMWIITDPTNNLPSAVHEGKNILDLFDMDADEVPAIDIRLDPQISKDQLLEQIRDYDIVHFAGHTDYESKDPTDMGWLLSCGTLTARDIEKMAGGPPLPSLVFANTCQSVTLSSWEKQNRSFDLAGAFMLSGVRHYIGTFWDIIDEPSSHFSHHFYSYLYLGQPIGEAIHFARQKLIEAGEDTCWTSYLLYGDPTVRYFDPDSSVSVGKRLQNRHEPSSGKQPDIQSRRKVILRIKESSEKQPRNWNKTVTLCALFLFLLLLISSTLWYLLKSHHVKDEWTSALKTIAVTYDESLANNRHDMIHYAIKATLMDHGRFILVERGLNFTEIEKELAIWERLPMNKNYFQPPELLQADLFIRLKILNDTLLMNVFDTHTSQSKRLPIGSIRPGNILAQKKDLAKNLLLALTEEYPLQGRITRINGKNAHLNIGKKVGVKVNHVFKVLERPIHIKIHTINEDHSLGELIPDNSAANKGWRVKIDPSFK